MKKSNIIIGTILLALSAFYYFSTKDLPPPSKVESLGAAFFPTLLAILLAALALMMVLTSLASGKTSHTKDEKAVVSGGERLEEDSFGSGAISYKFLLGTIGISIPYIVLLPIVGYLLITPIFLITMIRLLGKKKWLHNITVSALLTVALYLLFATMLGVTLPQGILSLFFS